MEKKVKSLNCKLVTCSALTQHNLNNVFDDAMNTIIQKRNIVINNKNPKKES